LVGIDSRVQSPAVCSTKNTFSPVDSARSILQLRASIARDGVAHVDRPGITAMSSSPTFVDREIINTSFRDWQEEQTLLDAQLAESVAALDAYQSHLDGWQQELARERDELRNQRESLERDRAAAGDAAQQVQQLSRQLEEMQTKN
jgi:hypothetical protein